MAFWKPGRLIFEPWMILVGVVVFGAFASFGILVYGFALGIGGAVIGSALAVLSVAEARGARQSQD